MHGPLKYVQNLYYTQKFSNCPSTFLEKTPFFTVLEICLQLYIIITVLSTFFN